MGGIAAGGHASGRGRGLGTEEDLHAGARPIQLGLRPGKAHVWPRVVDGRRCGPLIESLHRPGQSGQRARCRDDFSPQ